MNLHTLRSALESGHLEIARRIGRALLADPATQDAEVVLGLHDALAALTDFREASNLLDAHADILHDQPFAVVLRLAEDAEVLSSETHYRLSDEARVGLTIDEYLTKYRALADQRFAEATRLADTPARLAELRAAAARCKRKLPPEFAAHSEKLKPSSQPGSVAAGSLHGRIILPDGASVAGVTLTLGLEPDVVHCDPATNDSDESHYHPKIGELRALKTTADADGNFQFSEVPPGKHDFLAVTLDAARHAIPTRFIARNLTVAPDRATDAGKLVVNEWRSAPASPYSSPHATTVSAEGRTWHKLSDTRLHNPFYYEFRRQALRLPLPTGFKPASQALRAEIIPGKPEPFQIVGREVVLFTGLPQRSNLSIALFASDGAPASTNADSLLTEESAAVWLIDTGRARFRIAGPGAALDAAPILSARGPDQRWRGQGRLVFPAGVTVVSRETVVVTRGALLTEVRTVLHLSNGTDYAFTLAAHAGEPFLGVRETSPDLPGAAFEFSLSEFSGGRGFLHWTPEKPFGSRHWWSLEKKDALIAKLPEQIPWWIPPQGFGYAFSPDSIVEKDLIGVISLRRGEWIDREFNRIAQGPIDADGSENRELDWPFPEMVGSSISMITGHTTAGGDVFFRFGCFDGERQWGLYVGEVSANTGLAKEIAGVQHAYSSPRLQEFKDWNFDVPDVHARPHVVASRDSLVGLREKTRHPLLGKIWEKIRAGIVPGPAGGLTFAVEADPVVAWRRRLDLVRTVEVQARKVLLGRDRGDAYSPVMGRPITPWAEEYDLLAASGVFDADEERTMRSYFILMGHMFMEPDFMNWQFNARNANFEADRTDIVGAVGLVFDGHPDADKFLNHVIALTKKSLLVYCTPGSGKWYENPACYYLQASKCRMNLVYHLVRHGRIRLDEIPRLKDFLRWGIVLLQPPTPVSYAVMRDGGGAGVFDRVEKIRRVPPIGDHASIGRWIPEHYATIGKLFQEIDPDFARELTDTYYASNADGVRLAERYARPIDQVGENIFHDASGGANFGNLPLFFSAIDAADLPSAVPPLPLASRRLEGFGAVFRDQVNTDREGYVLLKQGPGGYRYHRTEGSIIFFADGHPLVYDGGEAGETWRHSTLSFHDVHMPLMSGHVERCFSSPAFHFSQGVHPGAVAPGKAVYLSDTCEHELVEESYRRFRQKPPGVVRSLAWLGGRTLVIHDAIELSPDIPSHWHLQVVGETPSGNAASGFLFPGRFGTDLQVLFPGQKIAKESVEYLPILEYRAEPRLWFGQQHLQVSAPGARDYLAVLHPLDENGPVSAEAIHHAGRIVGAIVRGANGVDRVWFGRNIVASSDADHAFEGSSGSLRIHAEEITLALIGSGRLQHAGITLESRGANALLTVTGKSARLVAQGSGDVLVTLPGKLVRTLPVDGSADFSFTV
ncbi:MAG: hypothetical protein ABW223_01340 [Rariglobus sp.]